MKSARSNRKRARRGVSLIETLCVLGILSVLVGMYAWAVLRAFVRIKAFLETLH